LGSQADQKKSSARWLKVLGGQGLSLSPYFSINCALLSAETIERLLFGYADGEKIHETLAGLRQVAFLVGTAFLDEVNTLPKGVENKFLRLLASPYEGMMYKDQDAMAPSIKVEGLNVLYVFASNARPEELIENYGLNSAFIGRIRQNYFEIPPLRERPEDIALALSCMFQKRSEDSPTIIKWKRIDLNAFRFLCTLPWEDNLRGLQGFVDALSLQRQIRGTVDEEEIQFEEVIECAVRRNLISSR
jgi:arginine utilization regulatory protein